MSETTKRLPVIAGNWKMNLDHLEGTYLVQKIAWALQDAKFRFDSVEVAVLTPFTDLRTVQTLIDADDLKIEFGAQDVSEHENGAFTGEVSNTMLAKLHCKYTIVGHSERRQYHGENDPEILKNKLARLYEVGINPIFCVGEPLEVRKENKHIEHVVKQLSDVLTSVDKENLDKTIIAYEPVWAIGTGETATADDAQEVCAAIRNWIRETFGDESADKIRIQYGGSAKPANARELMSKPDVDGLLVGGASLEATSFSQIVTETVEAYK